MRAVATCSHERAGARTSSHVAAPCARVVVVVVNMHDMPLAARSCAIASVVIACILNPLFAFDDAVCFTAYDVLARGQLWRLAFAVAYVDGIIGCVVVVILAARAIAAFETQHGTLRCISDGILAVVAANVCALATSLVVAPFVESALSPTAISGSGVVIAAAVIGTRQCHRASANVDVAISDALAISARKLPAVVALTFVFFGSRVAEVAGWYLAGVAWAEGHLDAFVLSDERLESLERGACARVRRQQGYVGVRGDVASLPTSSIEGHDSLTPTRVLASVVALVTHVRDHMRGRLDAYANRRREASTEASSDERIDGSPTTFGATPSTSSSSTSHDTRPKPESREERAAAFASALERRMRAMNDASVDREDEASASPTSDA